jgi:nicotinamide-nucleotide amidase
VRITAKAASEAEADALIAPLEAQVRGRLGHFIYGEGQESVEEVTVRMLKERDETLAVVDGAGTLIERLARLAGGEEVFRGGDPPGPEAAPDLLATAVEHARNTRAADWGVGVSMDLRPEAGKIYLYLRGPRVSEARSLGFAASPALAPDWAATAALNLLRLALIGRLSG